jgi:hypothetical protein
MCYGSPCEDWTRGPVKGASGRQAHLPVDATAAGGLGQSLKAIGGISNRSVIFVYQAPSIRPIRSSWPASDKLTRGIEHCFVVHVNQQNLA